MPTYATDMWQQMAGETWISVNSTSLLSQQMTLNEYNTCFPRTLASDPVYLTKDAKPAIYFIFQYMAI